MEWVQKNGLVKQPINYYFYENLLMISIQHVVGKKFFLMEENYVDHQEMIHMNLNKLLLG